MWWEQLISSWRPALEIFILAVAIVHSRFLERTLYPYLILLNSIPKVALAPLFVMWLGVGIEPKIAIALMIAVFSIVIDTILGLRSVDPDMLSLAKASRASQWHILFKIRLPNALPSMFAGMKVGIAFALVGAASFLGGVVPSVGGHLEHGYFIGFQAWKYIAIIAWCAAGARSFLKRENPRAAGWLGQLALGSVALSSLLFLQERRATFFARVAPSAVVSNRPG